MCQLDKNFLLSLTHPSQVYELTKRKKKQIFLIIDTLTFVRLWIHWTESLSYVCKDLTEFVDPPSHMNPFILPIIC